MSTVFLFSFIVKYMLLLSLRAREAVRVRMYVSIETKTKKKQTFLENICQNSRYLL